MSKTWAILPVKAFDRAKSRLSTVLASGQRESVARLMAADVLQALSSTPQIDHIMGIGTGANPSLDVVFEGAVAESFLA